MGKYRRWNPQVSGVMVTKCEGQTRLRLLQLPATKQARRWYQPNHKTHEGGLGKVAGRHVIKLGVRPLIFVTLPYLRLRG